MAASMQSISFARSTAGSTSSLRRKNVAPRRIVNTQAQAKVRLKISISARRKKRKGEKQRSKASERGEKRRSRGEMHPDEMGDEEDVASRFRTPNVVQKSRCTFTRVIYPFSRSKDVVNALVRARFRRSFFSWLVSREILVSLDYLD